MSRKDIAKDGKKTRFSKQNQPAKRGRPEGTLNRATILKKWLHAAIDINNPITKAKERGTVEDEVVLALITQARLGNVHAIREILDTAYGKQSNVNFNLNPEELQNLTDEELDSLIAKANR